MRILIPAFAFAVLFSSAANAITLSEALEKSGCPSTSSANTDAIKKQACDSTAYHLCKDITVSECDSYGIPGGVPSRNGGAVNAEITKKKAIDCCQGNKCGDLSPEGAKAWQAQSNLKSGTGAADAAEKAKKSNSYGFVVSSDYVGICESAKTLCKEKFTVLINELNVGNCAAGTTNCAALQEKKRQYETQSAACDGLNSEAFKQQASAYHEGSEKAAVVEEKTKEGTKDGKPSETTPQSKTAEAKGEGKGDGMDMKKILQTALPLLGALLQNQDQQQQQTDQQYQPQSISGCEPGPDGLPVLSTCPTTASTPVSFNPESSGNSGATPAGSSNAAFNVGDNSNTNQGGMPLASGGQGTPITTAAIPGGTGFGAAGGAAPASLGGAGGGGGSGGAKVDTNIIRGEGGGGGGGTMALSSYRPQTGEGGGFAPPAGGGEFENLRLSDYLPGGANYKGSVERGLAGMGSGNVQIQSANVNIWNRVSDIFRSRCAQGLLRDCGP